MRFDHPVLFALAVPPLSQAAITGKEDQVPLHRFGEAGEIANYCALFFASWAFCWSSFSSAAFNGTSLTVSLSTLPVKRYGGW